MISKFLSGAALAGAVAASVAGVTAPANAAAPATTHTQAKSAAVVVICDGMGMSSVPCYYPDYLPYGFGGSYYPGYGQYFQFQQPWFGGWWGNNWDDYGWNRWGHYGWHGGPRWHHWRGQ